MSGTFQTLGIERAVAERASAGTAATLTDPVGDVVADTFALAAFARIFPAIRTNDFTALTIVTVFPGSGSNLLPYSFILLFVVEFFYVAPLFFLSKHCKVELQQCVVEF